MNLKKCDKPDCFRQVKINCMYCCTQCSTAADFRVEVYEHTTTCDKRHEERGDYFS